MWERAFENVINTFNMRSFGVARMGPKSNGLSFTRVRRERYIETQGKGDVKTGQGTAIRSVYKPRNH